MSTQISPSDSETPRRSSRFIEGSPSTGPDLLERTASSAAHFNTILSEMDEYSARRKRGSTSNSSVSSSNSKGPISASDAAEAVTAYEAGIASGKENTALKRQSTLVSRSRSTSEVNEIEESVRAKLAEKVKGRLRALTANKDDTSKWKIAFHGT